MPTLIKKSYSQAHQNEPDPLLLETLLRNLKFPRCCVCDLGWFEDLLENDDDDDHVVVQEEEYKLLMTTRCKNLIPLPRCSCTTTLLTNEIVPNNNNNNKFPTTSSSSDEYKHLLEEARSRKDGTNVHWYSDIHERLVETFCYQDNFQKYNHAAMCKQCLYTFVSSSEDVIEHDYMSETQPNMKFSVGGKCPCCRRKFTARSLNALVQSVKKKEEEDHNENGCSGGKDAQMMEKWVEHNVNTILFLKFAKQLKKILASSEATAVGGTTKNDILWQESTKRPSLDIMERWIHDEEEHLSDDCFSDHEMTMMMDGGSLAACSRSSKHQRRVGVRIIPPDEGEIRKHLLEKDPKFRQECEDLEYIKQMASTVEGRRALGMESPLKHSCDAVSNTQLEQDELFARKLQCEWNGTNANYYYNNNNKKQKKSPLLKYFSKIGHGKEGAVSQTTSLGSGKRQIQDKGLYDINQEKSSIDTSTQSSMEEPTSKLHVQTVSTPRVDERTGSVSNTNDKDEILSQRAMETIVIFDSDNEEKDGRGRLMENIGHSESKKSTTSSKQESTMKCSPTTTNVDIFLHDETLQSAKSKENEEVNMDQFKKGHDDGSDRTQQELPQMILNNQYSKNEMTARQIILNENEINNMIAMGFSRQECLEALQDAENNGELAVNLLLDRRNLA
jgi:UBA/TS-N domain.